MLNRITALHPLAARALAMPLLLALFLFSAGVSPKAPPQHPPLSTYERTTIDGFTILLDPASQKSDALRHRRVLAALSFDLDLIVQRIPAPALDLLRQTPIVLTAFTEPTDTWKGRGCCYHASAGWLTSNNYDAAREGVVEILNADDFLQWRAEQPMMLLHELAHAYHHRLDVARADVQQALTLARADKLYDQVPYVLLEPSKTKQAYAITNATEYFAELTEAYYGRNDYFPFTRTDLKAHDPRGYAVVEKLWNLSAEDLRIETTPKALRPQR